MEGSEIMEYFPIIDLLIEIIANDYYCILNNDGFNYYQLYMF